VFVDEDCVDGRSDVDDLRTRDCLSRYISEKMQDRHIFSYSWRLLGNLCPISNHVVTDGR